MVVVEIKVIALVWLSCESRVDGVLHGPYGNDCVSAWQF